MDERKLFALALGLEASWYVKEVEFIPGERRLNLVLDFERGAKFLCPECGDPGTVHDTKERTWRHLDFFQHQTFLRARVPRVICARHGVRQVAVAWARTGSGFTLLFEALAVVLCREMAVGGAARLLRCHANSLWRILAHYVDRAVARADYGTLRRVGVDECSRRKGHAYLTTFCDLDQRRVVYVAPGRRAGVFGRFRAFLKGRGIDRSQITDICMDMFGAYKQGASKEFPEAAITYDRYHVMALMNKALDEVRRSETKKQPLLRRSRYLWLKHEGALKARQRRELNRLKKLDLKTVRAYQMKLTLQRLWEYRDPAEAEAFLKTWCNWAVRSRIAPVREAAKTIRRHDRGVLQFITSRITTGIVEGLNSKIKTAMKRAYGFKSLEYLRTIIYLVAGKLAIHQPTQL